tara:strand:+ start:247 stop:420 length:174 start_codon:yes stop_codon:yes gene_type:complete
MFEFIRSRAATLAHLFVAGAIGAYCAIMGFLSFDVAQGICGVVLILTLLRLIDSIGE